MKENRLPTIIAIAFLLFGVVVGVLLVESKKVLQLRASAGVEPKYMRVSNNTDQSFTVSWVTDKEAVGQVMWGASVNKLDHMDISSIPYPNYTHSVTIKNLSADTTYYFKIISNSKLFDSKGIPWKTATGAAIPNSANANPISGIVTTKAGMPVANALVYAVVGGGNTLSTTTEKDGSWYLLISDARSKEGNTYVRVENDTPIEISVFAGPFGVASVKCNPPAAKPLPVIRLGETYSFN